MLRVHAQVTCQSDIFSLGVMLFFCTTRRFPFCEANASTLTICHRLTENPKPAESLQLDEPGANPTWQDGLAQVVAKALRKSLQQRYSRAEAMLKDVKDVQRFAATGWVGSGSLWPCGGSREECPGSWDWGIGIVQSMRDFFGLCRAPQARANIRRVAQAVPGRLQRKNPAVPLQVCGHPHLGIVKLFGPIPAARRQD